MNLLIIAIAGFFIGQSFPSFARPCINKVKKLLNKRRLKPFDCEACVSFWATLGLSLVETSPLMAILTAYVVFKATVNYEKSKLV